MSKTPPVKWIQFWIDTSFAQNRRSAVPNTYAAANGNVNADEEIKRALSKKERRPLNRNNIVQ